MRLQEAIELIRGGVPAPGGTWADLGAGTGVFTIALATLLGAGGRVHAVDRDPSALAALRKLAARRDGDSAGRAEIIVHDGDFGRPFPPGSFGPDPLDGVLLANALHFVEAQAPVLRQVASLVRRGGRVTVVEYEGRRPNPWVPYLVASDRLAELAREAELGAPAIVGRRPSRFGGWIYAAAMDRR